MFDDDFELTDGPQPRKQPQDREPWQRYLDERAPDPTAPPQETVS